MDPRPEGIYCRWETEPPEGGPYSRKLLIIERVNGDQSVSKIVCTHAEAGAIREFLKASTL